MQGEKKLNEFKDTMIETTQNETLMEKRKTGKRNEQSS